MIEVAKAVFTAGFAGRVAWPAQLMGEHCREHALDFFDARIDDEMNGRELHPFLKNPCIVNAKRRWF